MENISVKSILLYMAKRYRYLCLGAVIGMVVLSALNVVKGKNYSDKVVETDVISREDYEQAQDDLRSAQDSLDATEQKLLSQQNLLKSYEETLEEYKNKWKNDIYIQTNAANRYAVTTVYQYLGSGDTSVRQALNALKASMSSMYAEVAEKMTAEDMTTYNMERLFSTDVNLTQNQAVIKVSSETEEELGEIITLYHVWMERKLAEYQEEYPDAELSMKILDEDKYQYYDSDIFSEQRSAADKEISLQNNIASTKNSIASAQKDINDYKGKISDAETELKKAEKLWNNTLEVSESSGKVISKTSILIYLILGAVVGIVVSGIVLAAIYMYGRKLHDSEDLESRTGGKVIGTLYSPVYRGKAKVMRKIDQWSGVQEITDMEQQYRRLATDIRLQMNHLQKKRVVLTGTVSLEDLLAVRSGLEKYLGEIEIMAGENPLYQVETAEQLSDADMVILLEKIGASDVKEIRKLRDYLTACGIGILGGITE